MDPLRICIVGCGDIVRISRIYSVVDIDPEVAR